MENSTFNYDVIKFPAGKLDRNYIGNIDTLVELIDKYKKLESAIDNSVHYQLLEGKTQMIGRQTGDYQTSGRSRLDHTQRIVGIVKKVTKEIYENVRKLNPHIDESEELKRIFELNCELDTIKGTCIAKAHDMGHIAFAHTGEHAMNGFFYMIEDKKEIEEILREHRHVFGKEYETEQGHTSSDFLELVGKINTLSFEHNELSAVMFDKVINNSGLTFSKKEYSDLILGVLAHSTSRVRKFGLIEDNLPAQIVRAADKIEYRNGDYDEIKDFIIMSPEMTEEIKKYLSLPYNIRTEITCSEIAKEAIERGKIWETRINSYDNEPVMKKLSSFRKDYEDLIFLYDSLYSYRLLKEELLPLADKPDQLKKFYEENPGFDLYYSADKIKAIAEEVGNIEGIEQTDDIDMEDPVWKYTVPFRSVIIGENSERIFSIYLKVLDYYYKNPDKIPSKVNVSLNPIKEKTNDNPKKFIYKITPKYLDNKMQRLFEYISLFDDQSMLERYYDLVEERINKGPGYGIEPVTVEELRSANDDTYEVNVRKFNRNFSTEYTPIEAEKLYIKRGIDFFQNRLTEKGKEVYRKNIYKKFSEFAIDKKLIERMIEADRARGQSSEDFGMSYYDEIDMKLARRRKTETLKEESEGQAENSGYIGDRGVSTASPQGIKLAAGDKKVTVEISDGNGVRGTQIKAKHNEVLGTVKYIKPRKRTSGYVKGERRTGQRLDNNQRLGVRGQLLRPETGRNTRKDEVIGTVKQGKIVLVEGKEKPRRTTVRKSRNYGEVVIPKEPNYIVEIEENPHAKIDRPEYKKKSSRFKKIVGEIGYALQRFSEEKDNDGRGNPKRKNNMRNPHEDEQK